MSIRVSCQWWWSWLYNDVLFLSCCYVWYVSIQLFTNDKVSVLFFSSSSSSNYVSEWTLETHDDDDNNYGCRSHFIKLVHIHNLFNINEYVSFLLLQHQYSTGSDNVSFSCTTSSHALFNTCTYVQLNVPRCRFRAGSGTSEIDTHTHTHIR